MNTPTCRRRAPSAGYPDGMTDLATQFAQHLAALRAAGIDWVPVAPPPPPDFFRPATAAVADPPAVPAADPRRQALPLLANEVANCGKCPELFATRTRPVFGDGPLSPAVLFLGQAPAAADDASGEPFTGGAGQLFDRILAAMGLTRAEVYLTQTIKCRPPKDRQPSATECANCRDFLRRQIEIVDPTFICCLGTAAARTLLDTPKAITELRGTVHQFAGRSVVCTLSPEYLLTNPAAKKDCWEDMKLLLKAMGRPVPG